MIDLIQVHTERLLKMIRAIPRKAKRNKLNVLCHDKDKMQRLQEKGSLSVPAEPFLPTSSQKN